MARRNKARPQVKRRRALKAGILLSGVTLVTALAAEWYVHHPREWLDEAQSSWPSALTSLMLTIGNPVADITDAFGLTGHDAVYEYDLPPPQGTLSFAGLPRRVSDPAPADIQVLDRGAFKIGWSPSLRHPVWCAYRVGGKAKFADEKRPSFLRDRNCPSAPHPDDYRNSGYDRGHMVPNYAILTRFGEEARRKTFLMSNIAPQSAALNRGVWRDFEHRIADLWTRAYDEVWVIVGAVTPANEPGLCIKNTNIDIPSAYYQVVMAQKGVDVRALAVLLPQRVNWDAWAARSIISIDDLEKATGLDFNPDLPSFIQEPLEADTPTRLWPIHPLDIFRQLAIRYAAY